MVLSTMGEDITNMRQILMQYQEMLYEEEDITTPYKTYMLNVTRTAQFEGHMIGQVGRLDYVAAPYSFFHGGMVVRIFKKDVVNKPIVFMTLVNRKTTQVGRRLLVLPETEKSTRTFLTQRAIPTSYVQEGVVTVNIPAYNPCSVLRNTPLNVETNTVDEPQDQWLCVTVESSEKLSFCLSMADDRVYGRPVGLPEYLLDGRRDLIQSPAF